VNKYLKDDSQEEWAMGIDGSIESSEERKEDEVKPGQ